MIACLSVFIIAALKSFSGNSSMCVITSLVGIDCLSPCKLRFPWFYVCWITLDYILDVLNIMLWNSEPCLKPLVWRYSELWCSYQSDCLCLIQRPQMAVSCILFRFYSCIKWERKVDMCLQHLTWNENK